jgi:hypothetical protein
MGEDSDTVPALVGFAKPTRTVCGDASRNTT